MSRSPNLVVVSREGDNPSYARYVGRTLTDKFVISAPLAAHQVEALRHDPRQFEASFDSAYPDPEDFYPDAA